VEAILYLAVSRQTKIEAIPVEPQKVEVVPLVLLVPLDLTDLTIEMITKDLAVREDLPELTLILVLDLETTNLLVVQVLLFVRLKPPEFTHLKMTDGSTAITHAMIIRTLDLMIAAVVSMTVADDSMKIAAVSMTAIITTEIQAGKLVHTTAAEVEKTGASPAAFTLTATEPESLKTRMKSEELMLMATTIWTAME